MSSATWVRAALQVNSYGYHGKAAPSLTFASEEEDNTALLNGCEHLGTGLIEAEGHGHGHGRVAREQDGNPECSQRALTHGRDDRRLRCRVVADK